MRRHRILKTSTVERAIASHRWFAHGRPDAVRAGRMHAADERVGCLVPLATRGDCVVPFIAGSV